MTRAVWRCKLARVAVLWLAYSLHAVWTRSWWRHFNEVWSGLMTCLVCLILAFAMMTRISVSEGCWREFPPPHTPPLVQTCRCQCALSVVSHWLKSLCPWRRAISEPWEPCPDFFPPPSTSPEPDRVPEEADLFWTLLDFQRPGTRPAQMNRSFIQLWLERAVKQTRAPALLLHFWLTTRHFNTLLHHTRIFIWR